MEPSLKDMDDYNRPLKRDKIRWILIAFLIAIAIYVIYAFLMESYS